MLVETFCMCFLQTLLESSTYLHHQWGATGGARQALFLYVSQDKICGHFTDRWPHWATKYLLVVHLLITISQFKLRQLYNLRLSIHWTFRLHVVCSLPTVIWPSDSLSDTCLLMHSSDLSLSLSLWISYPILCQCCAISCAVVMCPCINW